MAEVTITSIRLVPPSNPARMVKGEKDTLVTYTVDGKEQAFVIVEGADPAEDAIKKAIAGDLKLQQFKGKVIKIP